MAGMGRDGVGLKLGCWAGGMIEPQPRPAQELRHVDAARALGHRPLPAAELAGQALYVNEAMAQMLAPATFRQPLGIYAAVTDADYMEMVKLASVDHGAPNWGVPDVVEEMHQSIDAIPVGDPAGGVVLDVSGCAS